MFSINANSQLLTNQDFNFSGLLTANGWTAHSGAGTNAFSTTTGLTFPGLTGSGVGNAALVSNLGGEDANVNFAVQATDGQSIYFSALVNVTDAAAAKTGEYLLHLGTGPAASMTLFSARVGVRIVSSNVNFGLSNTSTITYGPTNFAKNITYLIIVKYTISVAGNDPVSLWVIPAGVPSTEAAAGTPELTSSTAGQNSINAIALRQGTAANSPQTVVDNILVGLTWADITPSGAATPLLSAPATLSGLAGTVGSASSPLSFNVAGANLTGAPGNVLVTASAGMEVSLSSSSGFGSSVNIPYASATLSSTPIYVRLSAAAPQGAFAGTVTISGGGASNVVVNVSGGVSQNYYNTKAALGLNNIGTWSTTVDGTGPSPASFTSAYQNFHIIDPTKAQINATWDVTAPGNTSFIFIGDGATSLTVIVPPGSPITATSRVNVTTDASIILQDNVIPTFNTLETGSSVYYSQSGTSTSDTIRIQATSYSDLHVVNGLKYFSAGTTTVRGGLNFSNVVSINGAASPFSTINALGDVNFFNSNAFEPLPTGDNARLTLKMNGPGPTQALNGNGTDIKIFRLQRDSASVNAIVVGSNTTLTLGNNSSGGLQLNPAASSLVLGANTLNIIGAGIFTASSNGKITAANSQINVLKSAGAFDAGIIKFNTGSILNQITLNLGAAVTEDSVFIGDNVMVGVVNLVRGKIVMTAGDTLSTALMNAPSVAPYSFVDGAVTLSGNSNLGFAVGKGQKFAPVFINNFGTSASFTVHYFNSGYGTYTVDPATLATFPQYDISRNEYWNVTSTTANPFDAVFGYTDAASGISSPLLVRMANFDNTDWADIGGIPDPTNTNTAGVVTVLGVTVRGPFTFSATTPGVVPVKLNSFAVQKQNTSARIYWSTESEINSREFVVERSRDGITWTVVGNVAAAGNSSATREYSLTDVSPARGINYYRLKSIDLDNRSVNSETRSLLFGNAGSVMITPNPATDHFNVFMAKDINTVSQIVISDVNGKIISRYSTIDQQKTITTGNMSKGLYVVKVITGENVVTQKIIIR